MNAMKNKKCNPVFCDPQEVFILQHPVTMAQDSSKYLLSDRYRVAFWGSIWAE